MAGTFQYNPPSSALGRPADLVVAALYEEGSTPPWSVLENVVPVSVQWFDGARPPVARFRYVFDDSTFPVSIEEVFTLAAAGPYVLQTDDRVGIFRYGAGGVQSILFDGYCLSPQADLDSESEQATITAAGVPHREFDLALEGGVYRPGTRPQKTNSDVQTGLPARFNPEGNPNASPEGYDSTIDDPRVGHGGETIKFPVFLGPAPPEDKVNGSDLRMWSLDLAVLYIMVQGNGGMEHVEWESVDIGDLQAFVPVSDGAPIDVNDPSTYTLDPIDIEDVDVTGMCWPTAVESLIRPHGFSFRWKLSTDSGQEPKWTVEFFRVDATSPLKHFNIQQPGNDLDPYQTNVQELHLSRDGHAVINALNVDMAPTIVEASFILAPGFEIDAADAMTPEKFVLGDATCTGDNLDKYRLFVLDELGEGDWDFESGTFRETPASAPDLDGVLRTKTVYGGPLPPKTILVDRRRRPLSPIVSVDADTQESLQAKLHVSYDYGRTQPGVWDTAKGDVPGVWDGESGTWDEVPHADWSLLNDQIGIRITAQDVSNVTICPRENCVAYTSPWDAESPLAKNNGKINLLEALTLTNAQDGAAMQGQGIPVFMLTCAVEADFPALAAATAAGASPTQFVIHRRYDARHRFFKKVVSMFSFLADPSDRGPNGVDFVAIDDTDSAKAMANASLRAHQFATFAGSVHVPRITVAYEVGDHIDTFAGRDIDMNQNASLSARSSPVYPMVDGITWTFEDRQGTTLNLTDQRAEFQPHIRRQPKPKFSKV